MNKRKKLKTCDKPRHVSDKRFISNIRNNRTIIDLQAFFKSENLSYFPNKVSWVPL